MLNNIEIILLNTTHSGNIGSAARAIKTMGITKLTLVNPQCNIDENSYALASNASDILDNISIYNTLDEALLESNFIIGTTTRNRKLDIKTIESIHINTILDQRKDDKISILFGTERTGMTNEELKKCNLSITIPTNPDYSSLNLAMAIQIICYEIYKYHYIDMHSNIKVLDKEKLPSFQESNFFIERLIELNKKSGFIKNKSMETKIYTIFNKLELTSNDISILNGMLNKLTK
ncbi:MAG: RNA methyltransferase [Psittacicella sp.]